MKTVINIDDYLSEEEKKEIAIDAFKESIWDSLRDGRNKNKTNYEDYERVISNSVYHFLEDKIDTMLDCDTNEMIKSKVDDIIENYDYKFNLFRKKGAWQKEDSPAQTIAKQAVESHRGEMTTRIHNKLNETIDNVDFDTVYELFTDIFQDFLAARLTNDK